ncbi:hypothetical protein [Hydrogenophaga sp. 5NK40-0174]|uniref:hypothetical protein n=1 Tax=Hydrogenophaga sp. 5NK40-0174 TaxID=3127649 RepID=UPI003108EC40
MKNHKMKNNTASNAMDNSHQGTESMNPSTNSNTSRSSSISRRARVATMALAVALTGGILQGCATQAPPPPPPPAIPTNWKPVNTRDTTPQAIPLAEEEALHKFQMLPTDVTLRSMLQRWADENGGELEWQYPSDLTLVRDLRDVKENNLNKALRVVRKVYADQFVRVRLFSSKKMLVTELPGRKAAMAKKRKAEEAAERAEEEREAREAAAEEKRLEEEEAAKARRAAEEAEKEKAEKAKKAEQAAAADAAAQREAEQARAAADAAEAAKAEANAAAKAKAEADQKVAAKPARPLEIW